MLGGFHDTVPLATLLLVTFLLVVIISSESGSVIATTSNFSENIKSRINNLISDSLNDTGSLLNFTNLMNNGSNPTTNQLVLSNKVISSINSNGSNDGNSIVKDRVTTINGICNSEKVGGNGNDTLTSSGNCNDELTGGRGSDKFMCGEGNDTVRDYNSKEGDIILDKRNCEKIL